jgi:hypothetical protein
VCSSDLQQLAQPGPILQLPQCHHRLLQHTGGSGQRFKQGQGLGGGLLPLGLLHQRIQLAQLLLQVLVAPAARFHHWDVVSIGAFFSIETQEWTERIWIFDSTLSQPVLAAMS